WPKPRGLGRLALPGRYLRCVRRIAAEVERVALDRRTDIIFAAMAFSWVAATPVARRLGIPIVWRAGGTEGAAFERLALRAWAARRVRSARADAGRRPRRPLRRLRPGHAVVLRVG